MADPRYRQNIFIGNPLPRPRIAPPLHPERITLRRKINLLRQRIECAEKVAEALGREEMEWVAGDRVRLAGLEAEMKALVEEVTNV